MFKSSVAAGVLTSVGNLFAAVVVHTVPEPLQRMGTFSVVARIAEFPSF
jgi:hypothetical protein